MSLKYGNDVITGFDVERTLGDLEFLGTEISYLWKDTDEVNPETGELKRMETDEIDYIDLILYSPVVGEVKATLPASSKAVAWGENDYDKPVKLVNPSVRFWSNRTRDFRGNTQVTTGVKLRAEDANFVNAKSEPKPENKQG